MYKENNLNDLNDFNPNYVVEIGLKNNGKGTQNSAVAWNGLTITTAQRLWGLSENVRIWDWLELKEM